MTQAAPIWQTKYTRADARAVERHYTARLIAEELDPRGIGPVKVMPGNHPFDLMVSGREIEVKVARGRERGPHRPVYFQGLLHDRAKNRSLSGEIVIMLCVDGADLLWPYVIPRLLVGGRRTIEITSHPIHYIGQWAPYLGAFDYLT